MQIEILSAESLEVGSLCCVVKSKDRNVVIDPGVALRHSYASLMLAAGVNVKAISQSLGHANIGITLDTYGHLLPGMGRTAAEHFDRLLKPWLVPRGCQQMGIT